MMGIAAITDFLSFELELESKKKKKFGCIL